MLRKEKYILLLLLIIMNACNNNQNREKAIQLPNAGKIKEMTLVDDSSTLIIAPENAKEIVITDSLVEGMPYLSEEKFIPLDMKNGPIGEISKVLFHQNRVIVLDMSRNNESVFIFDTLGRSINKIDDVGKGPKEFYGLGDVTINKNDNEIVLKDRLYGKQLYYDMDGNYLRTEQYSIQFSDFRWSNNKFIYATFFNQNWLIEDLKNYGLFIGVNDSVLYKGFRFNKYQEANLPGAVYTLSENSQGEIYFQPNFLDTIYHITSDSTYSPAIIFKFTNSYNEKLKSVENNMNELMGLVSGRGYSELFNNKLFEVDNSLMYIWGDEDNRLRYCLFDKNTNTSFEISDEYIEIPMRKIYAHPISIYKNYYVGAYEGHYALQLKDALEKGSISVMNSNKTEIETKQFSIANKELYDIIKNFEESGNPILVLYKFKFG